MKFVILSGSWRPLHLLRPFSLGFFTYCVMVSYNHNWTQSHHLKLNIIPVAYFAAVPLDTFRKSGQLIAAVFFERVFGDYAGRRVLPVFVALSSVCCKHATPNSYWILLSLETYFRLWLAKPELLGTIWNSPIAQKPFWLSSQRDCETRCIAISKVL